MSEFDVKALSWDQNPIHLERSKAIASELLQMVPVKKSMRVLEYGAGTGLLSFLLMDQFSEITLMDSSEEMLRICQLKIAEAHATHMKTIKLDLQTEEYHEKVDLIYNQMVFHHVKNIKTMVGKFYNMLNPGGFLAIADLYTEDGSFHGFDADVHKGFDIHILYGMLTAAGFTGIESRTAFVVKRKEDSGSIKEYPVFLLVAKTA